MMQSEHDKAVLSHRLPERAIVLVLAGGRGSRLEQLTNRRAKPAVYFGGKFRIIDFVLSNCINSGFRRIGVVTQYKSHSLLRHLQRGWSFLRGDGNEFIDLLPAQQRVNEEHWYRGTADAVYQNIDILRSYKPAFVVVLAGDHIYKMDYSLMLRDHVATGAGCTVGCIEVPKAEASAFGVMAIDSERHITDFVEKPADPPTMPGNPDVTLASMGIYIFNTDYLFALLDDDIANPESSHDFGKDIIPRVVAEGRAVAHPFSMSCIPSVERQRRLLARRRHGRRLLVGQSRPRLDFAGTEYLRCRLADLDPPGTAAAGQIRARPRRQSRHGGERAGIGRLHRVGLARGALGAVLERADTLLLPHRPGRHPAPFRDRRGLPPDQGRDRPRLHGPARNGHRRRCRTRCAALLPQRHGRGAGHQRHAGQTLKKNDPMTGSSMRVLHVCSEIYPLLKTGGLADVAGALPVAQAKSGCDARVLVPASLPCAPASSTSNWWRRSTPRSAQARSGCTAARSPAAASPST
jgi:dTDP-glucose pyrophosphorylase